MSTGKARRGAVAQVGDTFYGSLVQILLRSPPQYAIFGLNTSHEPLANPVRSQSCCAVAVARRPIAALRVVVVVRWYYIWHLLACSVIILAIIREWCLGVNVCPL